MRAGLLRSVLAILALALSPLAALAAGEGGAAFPTTEFAPGDKAASLADSGLSLGLSYERRPKLDPDRDVPVLTITRNGTTLLETIGVASGMDMPAADASIAEIDPYRLGKEVYFASYSGGAHCCTRVVVAEDGPKGWTAIPIGNFDGDGDYLEDVDGDGVAEIATLDDAFLYAFDCYACSAAPLVIHAVRDGKVIDVSAEPRFRAAHQNWLNELEDGGDPETRWSSPGFLAGWVAQSIRAGSGAAAYQALLDHWDDAADAGEETCTSGDDLDRCPKSDRRVLKFPDRLKLFLARHGYAL